MHHYVIIRQDLPIGVQLAQTIHAAGESSPGNLSPHTHAVALGAKSEAELLRLESKLQEAGVRFVAIREPDLPYNNQLMAIGIVPMVRDKALRKLLSCYSLVK